MKLSVVIATYRRASSLGRTLATIAAQRRLPDEVIVVDQSPDGERKAVEAVIKKASLGGLPVRLLWSCVPSSTQARNIGLISAVGDWVVFSDDDVDWPPEVVSTLVSKTEKDPLLVMIAARDICVTQQVRPVWHKLIAAFFMIDAWGPLKGGRVFACIQARYPEKIVKDMSTEWAMGYWFAVDRQFVSSNELLFDEKMTRYAQAEDMLFSYQLYRLAKRSGRRCIVSEEIAVKHLVTNEWREQDSFMDLCGAWNRIYIASQLHLGLAFWVSLAAIYWAAIHQTLVRIVRGRPISGHLKAYMIAVAHLGDIRAGRFGRLYPKYEKPNPAQNAKSR